MIITKDEFLINFRKYLEQIENGAVFIYPTDTIYGVGCDARNFDAIKKIRDIKQRKEQPFSVIAPSKDWILENCLIVEKIEDWIEKLPGAYTFILNLENKNIIAKNVNPLGDTIGVRIPNHWFTKEVYKMKFPILTTSANVHGREFMTSLDNLDEDVKSQVDFIIYEGEIKGMPSKLVDLSCDDVKEIKRK